jgi:hypothetical protein
MDLRYKNWQELPDDFSRDQVHRVLRSISGEGDLHLGAVVQEYLGVLETFCLGIDLGVYDLDTASQLYGGRIIAVAENYAEFITARRAETSRPTLYIGIEEMGRRLRQHEATRRELGLPGW